jgi:hypothetical protein
MLKEKEKEEEEELSRVEKELSAVELTLMTPIMGQKVFTKFDILFVILFVISCTVCVFCFISYAPKG